MTERERTPTRQPAALQGLPDSMPGRPLVADIEGPPTRQPAVRQAPIGLPELEHLVDHLDEHATPRSWYLAMRLQYVHDKHLRSVEWWYRSVWSPNRCALPLEAVKAHAREARWDELRDDVWTKAYARVQDELTEEIAEQALSAHRTLKAVEALVLDQLTPIVGTGPDGSVTLTPKTRAKSLEGLVGALEKVINLRNAKTTHAFELVAAAQRETALARESRAQPGAEADAPGSPTAERSATDRAQLRRLANLYAIRDTDESDGT